MSVTSLRSIAMAACRSSRLAPVTRTASPWMLACTLILLSLIERAIFLAVSALDAVLDLDDLLDLVAADLLDLALVEEAHVDVALGQLREQHVAHLAELEVVVAVRA